jgi:23S rRNA (cytidine1920-2'-O)/16S rRNA (cytidine1409-2'-O)-methyltransferase
MRADQLLVARGLAETRSQAQRVISSGVQWLGANGWQSVVKNGEELPDDAELQVLDTSEQRYVSRGGLKLEGALAHVGLSVSGRVCLDVGQSTGGFTDVLLQGGAALVVGVDVGHSQLHPRLAQHPEVRAFEGVNARELVPATLGDAMPADGFDLIVADLSFISITKVVATWPALLKVGGQVLSLVKPQFEVGKAGIGKGGLVKSVAHIAQAEADVRRAFEAAALEVVDYFPSAITGGDGNREFFIWAKRPGERTEPT